MTSDSLDERLAREPVLVECPICRHRQPVAESSGRCDQCGSEIEVFDDRAAAREALDALVEEGRVAYLREVRGPGGPAGLFAVVANRGFRKPEG